MVGADMVVGLLLGLVLSLDLGLVLGLVLSLDLGLVLGLDFRTEQR